MIKKHEAKVCHIRGNNYGIQCSCGRAIFRKFNYQYFKEKFGIKSSKKEDILKFFDGLIRVHLKYPQFSTDLLLCCFSESLFSGEEETPMEVIERLLSLKSEAPEDKNICVETD